VLELTETAVMKNPEQSLGVLTRLKSLGVLLALDDFGVGLSSIGRLRRLPVDIVKLDKSLVDHVPDARVASALIDALAGVARALRLPSVVEGVERADQALYLRAAGYSLAQGYYFSRPVDADAVSAILEAGGKLPIGAGVDARPDMHRDAARQPHAGTRVLVVDDDLDIAEAACRVLGRAGCTTVVAASLAAANRVLQREEVGALVVDIGLPDTEGWELVRAVRADERTRHIPVVVMTGRLDTPEVLNRAALFRAEYLGKPFSHEALLAKFVRASRLVAESDMAVTDVA